MKLTHLIVPSALAIASATGTLAQEAANLPPCDNCSDTLTISSWGGAYQDMQQKLFADPYMAATGIRIIWEESSGEAVAKLRAMTEAGKISWDLADVLASDGIRLCDEGLAQEVPFDEWLAPAPDGTPASEDLAKNITSDCLVPTNAYSTAFASAPMSRNGTARFPPRSAMSSILRNSPASARLKSGR